jgi:flagellar biosynthesis chaperone FliJ
MSKAGKAFLVVALIGAIAAAVFAFMIVRTKQEKTQELEKATEQLIKQTADLKKASEELTTTQGALKESDDKLKETATKAETLQASYETAQTKMGELEKSVKEAQDKITAAEARVEEVNRILGGKTAEEVKKEAMEAQEKLTALQNEKRIIDDQLAAASAEVKRLEDEKKRALTGAMPAGISGRIMTINKAWNFVVLNVGSRQGVVQNGVLIVYRGQKFLGKVKVVSTEENTAVADILPETLQGAFTVGDEVIN